MSAETKRSKASEAFHVYEFRITLKGTEPKVWRHVLVPTNISLERLHGIIQVVVGWQNSHLYEYEIQAKRYAPSDDEFVDVLGKKPGGVNISLSVVLKDVGSFVYRYDFGDSWTHQVDIIGRHNRDEAMIYPVCVGGENACPPEDCGGPPGYHELKEALKDENHEEHMAMKQWVGGYFNPLTFDPNIVNREFLWRKRR